MILKVRNLDISNNIKTYLSTAAVTGVSTLTVKNTTGFSQHDWIVIGNIGEEKTELNQIGTTVSSNTSLTVSALKFDHSTDTPVTYIKYDKLNFYKSVNGGATYSLLGTVDTQVDRVITTYDEPLAQANYYYKSCFYNSLTGGSSSFSSIMPGSGFPWYSLLTIQNRTLDLFPDPKEEVLSRNQMTDWMNEEYRRLVSLASKIDQGIFLKSNESSPSSLVSGTKAYDLPTDFKSLKKLEVANDGINYYRAYPQNVGFGYPNMTYDATAPLYVLVGNKFELRPTPTSSSGSYRIWYYYIPTPLSFDSDNVDLSLRPYIDALVYHCLARGKQKDKKYDEAVYWDKEVDKLESLMTNEMQNRTTMDIPKWVDITDTSWIDVDEIYC